MVGHKLLSCNVTCDVRCQLEMIETWLFLFRQLEAVTSSIKGGHMVWFNKSAAQRSCINIGRNAVQHDANSPNNTENGSDEKAGGKASKEMKRGRRSTHKKNKHIRFDDSGHPMVATPSQVLSKVQRFLRSAAEARSGDSDKVPALDPYSVCSKQWQSVDSDEDQESSDDDDVNQSGKYFDVTSRGVKKEGAKPNLVETDHLSAKTETAGTSLMGHSQAKTEASESLDKNRQWSELRDGSHDEDKITVPRKKSKKKKRHKNKKSEISRVPMPPEVAGDATLKKYWAQRYRLFSRFDEGIQLDYGL